MLLFFEHLIAITSRRLFCNIPSGNEDYYISNSGFMNTTSYAFTSYWRTACISIAYVKKPWGKFPLSIPTELKQLKLLSTKHC